MDKIERSWGNYKVLFELPGYKLKILTINPFEKMSLQRHFKRSEWWFVLSGSGKVIYKDGSERKLEESKWLYVPTMQWHQIVNLTGAPLIIHEVQAGECDESDIERK